MTVVRLSDGRDAIRSYVDEQVARGRDHVVALVEGEHERIRDLIATLGEDDARAVTPADDWSIFDASQHLAASLDRSRTRISTLSSGQPFTPPPGVVAGGMGSESFASFAELRARYDDGIEAILTVLRHADPTASLHVTADHAMLGPFNWLGWAVYSHHVHTHDHVDQIGRIRSALGSA